MLPDADAAFDIFHYYDDAMLLFAMFSSLLLLITVSMLFSYAVIAIFGAIRCC